MDDFIRVSCLVKSDSNSSHLMNSNFDREKEKSEKATSFDSILDEILESSREHICRTTF